MALHRCALLQTLAVSAVATAASPWPVLAQAGWPSRPLCYIVPFALSGTTDILGRVVGEKLALALGQPVVIENRPGHPAH